MLIHITLITYAMADIMDPRCAAPEAGVMKFTKKAINCEDRLSDGKCKTFYPTDIKVGSKDDRDLKCFQVK
ncbi:hypothetical protein DICVIV_14129 [Dictyocaulus viviparus]|uniref:Uncharacterized protein n=1 Tax=Dictyocaulus viviparus TaxID=29172 RepID=A0A0D8XBW6_DICVI|nr:hypothetical protein DICVIV_14129 [Dictyocaulus viviparus]